MKRNAVIKKLKTEAKRRGLEFEEIALTRHDAYRVGEIDDLTVKKFFDQFAQELGKGWWR